MELFKVKTRNAPVPGTKVVGPTTIAPNAPKGPVQPVAGGRLTGLMANEANARALAELMANATAEDRIRLALAVRYGGK